MSRQVLLNSAFPIEAVSDASSREKSIRQGHISTLQQWWARRPLGACRAALFAGLCPDASAVEKSRKLHAILESVVPGPDSTQDKLVTFTARLAEWRASSDDRLLRAARQLLMHGRKEPAVVLDSFAGGGSIPIEALRLGLNALAGELNPVAWIALTIALEDIPACDPAILEAFRETCLKLETKISAATAHLYQTGPEYTPLAFFWCWTIDCPSCKFTIPLIKDYWLAKGSRNTAVSLRVESLHPEFDLCQPNTLDARKRASTGTLRGSCAVCPSCSKEVPLSLVRKQGRAGRLGNLMYAKLVLSTQGERVYSTVTDSERRHARACKLRPLERRHTHVPDGQFDLNGIRHLWAIQYGIRSTSDLFNHRQGIALLEVLHELEAAKAELLSRLPENTARTLTTLIALVLNRVIMYSTRHAWWQSDGEFPANMFTKQAIPMIWNYVEIPVSSRGAAGWASAVSWVGKVLAHLSQLPSKGRTWRGDAAHTGLAPRSVDLVAIDPPYYDSIAYSYLSDTFYVWMKAYIGDLFPDAFSGEMSPKDEEAIVDRTHRLAPSPKSGQHFLLKLTDCLREADRVLKVDGRLMMMFGHKKVEAWEAALTAIHDAGFEVTESWPIHTERKVKFRHGTIDALSSSCLLYCKRTDLSQREAVSDAEFARSLRSHVEAALQRYWNADICGSDLVAALLATTCGVYWRMTPSGSELSLGELLRLLPGIVAECELAYMLKDPCLREQPGVYRQLCSIRNSRSFQSDRGSWLTQKHPDPLVVPAIEYATALHESKPGRADQIYRQLDLVDRRSLPTILRALALLSPADSLDRQLAYASLGRIGLRSRTTRTLPLFDGYGA